MTNYARLTGADREEYLRKKREYYTKNRITILARSKNKAATRSAGQRAEKSRYLRAYNIERKYGLATQEWDELFAAQNGVCALCRRPGRTGRGKHLHIDHCHRTGRVRGLLCFPCNQALGKFGDDEEGLRRAYEYTKDVTPEGAASAPSSTTSINTENP